MKYQQELVVEMPLERATTHKVPFHMVIGRQRNAPDHDVLVGHLASEVDFRPSGMVGIRICR